QFWRITLWDVCPNWVLDAGLLPPESAEHLHRPADGGDDRRRPGPGRRIGAAPNTALALIFAGVAAKVPPHSGGCPPAGRGGSRGHGPRPPRAGWGIRTPGAGTEFCSSGEGDGLWARSPSWAWPGSVWRA